LTCAFSNRVPGAESRSKWFRRAITSAGALAAKTPVNASVVFGEMPEH
jgi:hypothetical protein